MSLSLFLFSFYFLLGFVCSPLLCGLVIWRRWKWKNNNNDNYTKIIKKNFGSFTHSTHYTTTTTRPSTCRAHMKLTIKNLQYGDFGNYRCISKNSLGETEGSIRVYGKRFTPFLCMCSISWVDDCLFDKRRKRELYSSLFFLLLLVSHFLSALVSFLTIPVWYAPYEYECIPCALCMCFILRVFFLSLFLKVCVPSHFQSIRIRSI